MSTRFNTTLLTTSSTRHRKSQEFKRLTEKTLQDFAIDLKRLKINYVAYHNHCMSRYNYYTFVASYYDGKERKLMNIPILMLNGLSCL